VTNIHAKSRVSAFGLAGVLILAIAGLNAAFPRDFRLFSIDYLSWLPGWAQVVWTGVCLALLLLCRQMDRRNRVPAWAGPLVLAVFLVSLILFRTSQPTLHGDGESGYLAGHGHLNLREEIPEALAVYNPFDFQTPTCSLTDRVYELDQAAVLAGLLFGGLIGLSALVFLRRFVADPLARIGAFVLILAAPGVGGAYGHFDGYAECLYFQLAWWGALIAGFKLGFNRKVVTVLALLTVVAMWIHPLHLLLAIFAAYGCFLARVIAPRLKSPAGQRVLTVAAALVLALLPLLQQGNAFSNKTTRVPWEVYVSPFFWTFIHLKASSLLLGGLPALMAAFWFAVLSPWKVFSGDGAIPHIAALALLTTCGLVFFVELDMGIADEFLYGLLGAMVLGALLLAVLCQAPPAAARNLAYFAILSVFLQGPRVFVSAGDLCWERFRKLYPDDKCLHHLHLTPFIHLGFTTPIDRPEDRQRRLAALLDGADTEHRTWKDRKTYNLIVFTAWAYEFGERDQGKKALTRMLGEDPESVPMLWEKGFAYTHRYSNTAYQALRNDSRSVLQSIVSGRAPAELQPVATNQVYRSMLAKLAKVEADAKR
jgi:hypothetical protein